MLDAARKKEDFNALQPSFIIHRRPPFLKAPSIKEVTVNEVKDFMILLSGPDAFRRV